MNTREVQFLRRLIADKPLHRSNDGVAAAMCETEGLGKAVGRRVFYLDTDLIKAANILTTRGYGLESAEVPFNRSNAPKGGSEKTGAVNVTDGFIACRGIDMDSYFKMTVEGFCAVKLEDAIRMQYDAILVCENLEALIRLDSYTWLKPFYKGRRVIAVFRGTKDWFTSKAAAQFINMSSKPTLAFFDFDPKGLSMAASLPRREALCLPDLQTLEIRAKEMARQHLFTNSVHISRPHLETVTDPDIVQAWTLMKRITFGLNQEQF